MSMQAVKGQVARSHTAKITPLWEQNVFSFV